jgi:ABC-type uncharacterized transport system permease subunit
MDLTQLKIFWSMTVFESLRFKAYPLEVVASIFSNLAETTLFITFWLLVGKYAAQGSINPRDVISYYLIVSGMTPFFYLGFGIATQTIRIIKQGELNQILIKPVNPILYPWSLRTGRNFINIIMGLLQLVAGILLAGSLSRDILPLLLPTLFNAAMINAAFNIGIGTFGFYLTEASGVKNAFLHIAVLCRGELIPLFLLPAGLLTAIQFSPFPASQYHLAILLQGTRQPEWGFVLLGSLWAIALMFGAIKFWHHGLKHYEAIGI